MSRQKSGQTHAPRIFLLLGGVVAASFALFAGAGLPYYRLSVEARPFHPDHAVLRSSGTLGLSFGIAGTILMVLNLSYWIRKQVPSAAWLGSFRSWMAFHIFTGLAGPALITLHTAFQPQSALGTLAFAAMLVAVATGVLGRYIYAHLPRSIEGRELELEEARKRLERYRVDLENLGLRLPQTHLSVAPAQVGSMGVWGAFRALLQADQKAKKEFQQFRKAVLLSEQLRPKAREILPVARRLCRERQRIARFLELKFLMGSWRFFHRWLAIVMLLVVFFHIAIAVKYGDLWVLHWRVA